MPGENGISPADMVQRLKDARGRSAEAIQDSVITEIGNLAEHARTSGLSQEAADKAIKSIRTDLNAASAAAIEAQRIAMPAGQDAEVVRYYQDDKAPKSAVLRMDERQGRGNCVRDKVPYIGSASATPIRMWGSKNRYGEYQHGFLDDPNPRSANQKEVQRTVENIALCRALNVPTEYLPARLSRQLSLMPGFSRMFADNATEGAEWIPDTPGSTLIQYMQMPRAVSDLFEVVDIARNNFTNPFQISGLQAFLVGQPAAGDANPALMRQTQVQTGTVTYSAPTLLVSTIANRDAEEDSIVAFAPTMFAALAAALTDTREDAQLNGDTASTHQDTLTGWTAGGRWLSANTGGADDHRRAFIGLRARSVDDSTTDDFDNASISIDMLGLRGKLTKGFSTSSLAWISSLEALIYHLLTDSNLLTVQNIGLDRATLRTGQVAEHAGVPVILSEFMSGAMNTSGIYDGSTVSQTGMVLVDTSKVKRPRIRAARTEVAIRPEQHVKYIVASDREGFIYECGSGEKPVAYGIDISNDGT